jgi:hypothetical protein
VFESFLNKDKKIPLQIGAIGIIHE